MTFRREVAWILVNVTILFGFIFGLLNSIIAVHSQKYFDQGFYALTAEYFTRGIGKGVVRGLLLGVVSAILVLLISPLFKRFSGWMQTNLFHREVVQPDAIRGFILAALLSIYFFALTVYVFNTYYAAYHVSFPSVFVVSFFPAVSVLLFLATGSILSRSRPGVSALKKLNHVIRPMAVVDL